MSKVEHYKRMYEQCLQIIQKKDWWDGSYSRTTAEMGRLWEILSEEEQQEVLEYANRLYQKHLQGQSA